MGGAVDPGPQHGLLLEQGGIVDDDTDARSADFELGIRPFRTGSVREHAMKTENGSADNEGYAHYVFA
jgi:hypothetical protein